MFTSEDCDHIDKAVKGEDLYAKRSKGGPANGPFFSQADTKQALETLATAKRLTVVVGAGTSAEVGFPTWRELIEGLLIKVARAQGVTGEDLNVFRNWVATAEGLPAAGSMVRASLGSTFAREVRALLYADVESPRPGPTAQAVARIRSLWPDACEIATTNYDVLLEDALKAEFLPKKVKHRVDEKAGAPGDVIVRHLHGLLTPEREVGRLVLSEVDYQRMAGGQAWQESYFRTQLNQSACLFVGTSMTDPNLLRYLYRHHFGSRRHPVVVVLIRQADQWPGSEQVRAAREHIAHQRWREMGVTALYADFYSQSAQFVWEVARRRKLGRGYRSYGSRLDDWAQAVNDQVLHLDDPSSFAAQQDRLQQETRRWLDNVADQIEPLAPVDKTERLAIHVWVRRPSDRALTIAICSDRAWRDPRALEAVPIASPSHWACVNAFCYGTTFEWKSPAPGKWNYVVAIPVYLEDEPWGRMLVGVITLASTKAASTSVLNKLEQKVLDKIYFYLANNAADLLNP